MKSTLCIAILLATFTNLSAADLDPIVPTTHVEATSDSKPAHRAGSFAAFPKIVVPRPKPIAAITQPMPGTPTSHESFCSDLANFAQCDTHPSQLAITIPTSPTSLESSNSQFDSDFDSDSDLPNFAPYYHQPYQTAQTIPTTPPSSKSSDTGLPVFAPFDPRSHQTDTPFPSELLPFWVGMDYFGRNIICLTLDLYIKHLNLFINRRDTVPLLDLSEVVI